MKSSHFLLFFTLLVHFPIAANDNLQVSGFGDISIVASDSKKYGYRKDISYEDGAFEGDINFVPTLGIQFDYSITENFDLTYQAVYRNQNSLDFDALTNMAFARYVPNSHWTFRVGRTPLDLFKLTEYRDVGFAYSWVNPPTEIYGLIPYRHLDGVDVSHQTSFNNTTLRTKLFGGVSKSDLTSFDSDQEVKIDDVYGISLNLESFDWSLHANHTQLKANGTPESSIQAIDAMYTLLFLFPGIDNIWPDIDITANDIDLDNSRLQYTTLSGSYSYENLEIISEVSYLTSTNNNVSDVTGKYIGFNYHQQDHTYYLLLAHTSSKTSDADSLGVNTSALANIPGAIDLYNGYVFSLNFYSSNQSSLSLGWRWYVTENVALKTQLNRTSIDKSGGTLWKSDTIEQSSSDKINTLIVNLSFSF